MSKGKSLIPIEWIERSILLIRGKKVMLDADLAVLYGVPTKVLNQAVKRNKDRFPPDFMFRLTKGEKDELVTNCDRFNRLKHSTALPHAFTDQGVAILSGVLNSECAIRVNIESCGHLSVCGQYSLRTRTWLAAWMIWRKNTMPNSRKSLTRFASS